MDHVDCMDCMDLVDYHPRQAPEVRQDLAQGSVSEPRVTLSKLHPEPWKGGTPVAGNCQFSAPEGSRLDR